MSGGHLDYQQYAIERIADELEQEVLYNNVTDKNEFGDDIGNHYSDETIAAFKGGMLMLRIAAVYAQRADWLLSGDDGEEQFRERLEEDLYALLITFGENHE